MSTRRMGSMASTLPFLVDTTLDETLATSGGGKPVVITEEEVTSMVPEKRTSNPTSSRILRCHDALNRAVPNAQLPRDGSHAFSFAAEQSLADQRRRSCG